MVFLLCRPARSAQAMGHCRKDGGAREICDPDLGYHRARSALLCGMNVRRLLALLGAIATVVTLLLTMSPAQAARRVVGDTVGDAPARLDVTRYTVRNSSTRISAVIHVQNLKKTGILQQRYYDSAFDDEPSYGVQVQRDRHGRLHVHAFRDDENGDHNIVCRGVRARWLPVRNRVTTWMPVRCADDVAFAPLHAHVVSFDPGDLGVQDSTTFVAVPRD
jgi:hypothetical protein